VNDNLQRLACQEQVLKGKLRWYEAELEVAKINSPGGACVRQHDVLGWLHRACYGVFWICCEQQYC
jgi:hypothetical protein